MARQLASLNQSSGLGPVGLRRPNGRPVLSSASFCGFRAFLVQPGYYPTDLARGIRPFVDLLLTRGGERKKPRGEAGRKALI